MTTINLLPWRGPARARQNRHFALQLGLAAGAALLLLAVILAAGQWSLERQLQRNSYLADQVKAMAVQVEEIDSLRSLKQRQLERVALIRSLQAQRSDWVAVFAGLAEATPPGLYFTELSAENGLIKARGYAASNEAISVLLRALQADPVFAQATLSRVDRDARLGDSGSRFSLQVSAAAVVDRLALAEGEQ